MKKIFLSCFFVPLLFFIGCSSTPREFQGVTRKWCIPEIGTVSKSYIGDSIITEGIEDSIDSITIFKDYGNMYFTAYHPSGTYKYCGKETVDDHGNVSDTGITVSVYMYSFFYNKTRPLIYKYDNGNVFLVGMQSNDLLDKTEYKEEHLYEDHGYYFEQRLIYTGSEGNILKFSYREFQNDLARAAFTVDATYDISKDKILRFKSCTLEVISVDNQSITYKLMSGFKTEEN